VENIALAAGWSVANFHDVVETITPLPFLIDVDFSYCQLC
jgi:hypothetical protein